MPRVTVGAKNEEHALKEGEAGERQLSRPRSARSLCGVGPGREGAEGESPPGWGATGACSPFCPDVDMGHANSLVNVLLFETHTQCGARLWQRLQSTQRLNLQRFCFYAEYHEAMCIYICFLGFKKRFY